MTRNKTGSLLLSFAIALGLWMYVRTYVNTDYEQTLYNIPVALEGESMLTERQLMLLSEEDCEVNIKIYGSRQDVSKINSGNIQLVADLSKINEPGEHNLTYNIIFPGDVPTGAVSAEKNPDRVKVVVARKKTKEIPVKVTYQGDVPADYIKDISALTLDHSYVEISGPESVVDQIDHAALVIDCEDRTETIYESYRYELRDQEEKPVDAGWITTNVSEVKVYLPISMIKKIPLTLTVIDGGGASWETSVIEIEPKQISVSGSETVLDTLTELNLGTLDLSQITGDTVKEFEINLPEGIKNISNLPTARVSISFPRLATREFTITQFQALNLESGMTWEALTKQITITVRGLKSEVQQLSAEDIIVQLDLAGVENTSAVEPIILFPKSLQSLGAVGSYSVSVQVTPDVTMTEE